MARYPKDISREPCGYRNHWERSDDSRQMIGMFGDPPKQDRYLLILKKGHDWDWVNGLVETEEPI